MSLLKYVGENKSEPIYVPTDEVHHYGNISLAWMGLFGFDQILFENLTLHIPRSLIF